jgi:hypothetical protein
MTFQADRDTLAHFTCLVLQNAQSTEASKPEFDGETEIQRRR